MNSLYRFSPIKSKEELLAAIEYTAARTTRLCKKIANQTLPITSLTIFSHYLHEYEDLKQIALSLGVQSSENNWPYIALDTPIPLPSGVIERIRIRKPDPYRMQVGCNDFDIQNYYEFKNQFLLQNSDNLRLIERTEYEMIEFFDPDFDVLAYVLRYKDGLEK